MGDTRSYGCCWQWWLTGRAAAVSPEQSTLLADLRTAVRRYDIPDQAPAPDPAQLRIDLDRAIVTAQAALSGPEQAFATGLLHLHGMTLAGRLHDRAEEFPTDLTSPSAEPPG